MGSVKCTEPVDNAWSLTIPEFKPEDNPHGLVEESSFSTLFPKYREHYLKECWPIVEKVLSEHFIKADLDLIEGSMTVKTTRKTWDPYIIVKARDMIKLLSRSVPVEQAKKVLDDEMGSDIIKIGSMVRNKDKFLKRRQRLIGPAGCTLKSVELLTSCYMQIQGQTVAVVGPYRGLTQARRIIEDTMKNVHPIYNIKALMIKRELAKDPQLKNEDWSRFLPKYSKNSGGSKKKIKKKEKKEYTPFPPPPQDRKIDQLLASGEYFLSEKEKSRRKQVERQKKEKEAEVKRQEKRKLPFVAPNEDKYQAQIAGANKSSDVDLESLKKKIKKHKFK